MDPNSTEQQAAPGAEREGDDGGAEHTAPTAARPGLEVSGTQVVAGALASVSAAVVASIFGTAGTIIGTAVASVVSTVGAAVYSLGLRRTGAKLKEGRAALPIPPVRPVLPRGRLERWRDWLRQRRWGVVAGVGLVFVLALALVSLIELIGQRPLSSLTGGDSSGTTSIGRIVGGDGGSGSDGGNSDEPSPGDTSTSTTGPDATSTTSSSTSTTSPRGGDESPFEAPPGPSTTSTTSDSPTTTATESPTSTSRSAPSPAG